MSFLRNLPLNRKLTLISMLTSSAALLLACTAFLGYEQLMARREMSRDLSITTRMIGFNSEAALAFSDTRSAEQVLHGLNAQPHIMAACLYDTNNQVFATYQKAPRSKFIWPKPQADSEEFSSDALKVFRTISSAGEVVGTIFVQSDLAEIDDRWHRYALITGSVLLVSILMAWLITSRLQRVISGPVLELATIVERVATEQDYSVRALKQGDDELGRLIDGFNHMLAQIQARDSQLQAGRNDLEQRVEQRTAALKQAQGEMAQKEAQLRFIFEAVPFSVTWVRYHPGPNGNESLFNQAFFRITGLDSSRNPALGEVRAISHADDLKRQDEFRARLDRGEIDDVSMEKRYLHPGGGVVWVVLTIKVFRGPDGKIAEEVSTLVDITERKQTELKLEEVHKQLLETSRQAGMAEVATGVLHNVGNVLNSVNVSATLVADQVRRSKTPNLGKVCALLDEHGADLAAFLTADPKGKIIPSYLATLARSLSAEQQVILKELDNLHKNIGHIKDIVAMQQSYAKTSGVAETISIPDLVEDALSMNAGSLARHDVDIARDYEARPVVTLEKHKVLQILVNLVRNAKYACDESGRVDKLVTTRITADDHSVSVIISDNGVGIPRENLTRIFAHGFTTRKEGHGFGLHSGANAAKELGGSLTVQSDGPGRGATFTLKLPYKPSLPSP